MLRKRLWLCVLCVLVALGLTGCATAGGGAGADITPPEPEIDVRNEVGENGLLTPAAILARYVDAVGGEEALKAHQSSTTKGSMSLAAMGIEGDVLIHAAAPDRFVMNVEMGGMGSMNRGFNGEIGWSDDPMTGARLLEGDELVQMKQQAAFYGVLEYPELFPTMETVELTEFNGESAYQVRLVDETGKETIQYFSEESSLLLGSESVQNGPMGEAQVVTLLGGYEEFDGVLQPTKTTLQMGGMEIEQTVEEVVWDEVDGSAFEPPDSIKSLMK